MRARGLAGALPDADVAAARKLAKQIVSRDFVDADLRNLACAFLAICEASETHRDEINRMRTRVLELEGLR